ncbi:MAG: alpha/beta hydrolase fold domain-containing protein [Hymenobacteraceae bacterium]|nr:alpha/beta hydrolase fold domain-containing protein [Hymenobacteraceae bacterium]
MLFSRALLPLVFTAFGLLNGGFAAYAQAPTASFDTIRGRYYQPIFQQVTVTRGVTYGTAPNFQGQSQALRFDFYEPTGDTAVRRALIVFAHEGGFVGGTRNDAFITGFAPRLARLGYCVAAIDYRLLFAPFDTTNLATAAFRAMQDMRGAIRFFRADAAGANQFRIAPGFIVAAGASAGAVTALQTAHLDKPSEIPANLAVIAGVLGGLEGTSGPAGFSSRPQATISLCGALGRPAWLEAGDAPVAFVHGTADVVVPYGRGVAGGGLPPLRAYGPAVLAPRAVAAGVPHVLRTLRTAPHVPFDGGSARALAYADTTFWTIRDFLRPLVGAASPLRVAPLADAPAYPAAWPLPAAEIVRIRWGARRAFQPTDAALLEATTGRVVRRFRWTTPELAVPRAGLPAGTYVVRAAGSPPVRVVFGGE